MSLLRSFRDTKFMTIVEPHSPPGNPDMCQGLVTEEISVRQVRHLDKGLVGLCNQCGEEVEFSLSCIAKEVESNARQMRNEMNDLFDYARQLHVEVFTERAQDLVESVVQSKEGYSWSSEYQLVRLVEDVSRTIRHSDERQYGNMG